MNKGLFIFMILLCSACNNNSENPNAKAIKTQQVSQEKTGNETCFKGTISGNIPVFIHYQVHAGDSLIIGEITYLNTKPQQPIKLIGQPNSDGGYRLLEFDAQGNITGIIAGKAASTTFDGIWIAPGTERERPVNLTWIDTLMPCPSIAANPSEISGRYYYQYGEQGFQGGADIKLLSDGRVAFDLSSVTDEARGRNIANVDRDTAILTSNRFTYTIPESDNCAFETIFYKDFLFVRYTNGYCAGQFGLNASIDGIFMKIK